MGAPIAGFCDARFGAVREAFEANFAERGEVGAGVCVILDGETVVELAGGWADAAHTRPWRHDTLCDFYSVGKAFLALLLLRLVGDRVLRLDDPIASVWPEFAQAGKGRATIRHALSHQAGVPAIRTPLTDDDLFDWARMTSALAATAPWWVPGERHAYHTNTFGHLVGETLHRAGGVMPSPALHALATPLHADVWFGVPREEQHRCAEVLWAPEAPIPTVDVTKLGGLDPDTQMNVLAHFNPPGYSSMGVVNTAAWRSSQLGSTAGHGSATGIARLYAALAEPDRLLSHDLLAEAITPQVSGPCPILHDDVVYALGFTPTTPRRRFGPNPGSFGHFGTGGAVGFADPAQRLAFGYVMNHVIPRWQSSRNRALIDAVYSSLSTRTSLQS